MVLRVSFEGEMWRKHPPHFLFKHVVQHPCEALNLKLQSSSVVLSDAVLCLFYTGTKDTAVAAVIITLRSVTACQGPPLPWEFRGTSPLPFSPWTPRCPS